MDLTQLLGNHPLVTGGAALAVGGYVFAVARSLPARLLGYARARLITSVEINDNDHAFRWLERWLAYNPDAYRTRAYTLSTYFENAHSARAVAEPAGVATFCPGRGAEPMFALSPAPGLHFVRFRGRRVWLARERRELQNASGTSAHHDKFVVSYLGTSRTLIDDLITEAAEVANTADVGTEISIASDGHWRHAGYRCARSLDSVVLPDGIAEGLLTDFRDFLGSKRWYLDRGVPYQRGYLFHGPPGSGKTSIVTALAGELGLGVAVLPLSDWRLNDNTLASTVAGLPQRCILLIEDVDAAFKERKNPDIGLSFSGLLNALDGVLAPEGRLLVMTTNHPERLDPALIRPGRVDRQVAFEHASSDQAVRMFQWFFRDARCELDSLALRFAMLLHGQEVSMAAIQEHLLRHRDSPHAAANAPWQTTIAA
jgi:mitochondrial chaperone BCS1